jgi:pimeloyl-ACP methyl ester carboxylesterase
MTTTHENIGVADFIHHRVEACGVALHAVEAGSGPLLLLLSGWPQTWYSWRIVMPELARHFRVVAVDLPGLGDSDFPSAGYDTGSISLHLDAVLDAFDARDCVLVTHDIGAWVGYAYAARRPERVTRLVLMDAAIPGLAPPQAFELSPQTAARLWHFYFNAMPDLPELLITGREHEFLSWLFRTKTADATFDQTAINIYAAAYSAPGRWSGGMGYYRAVFESMAQNKASAATALTMPVLAIGGAAGMGAAMAAAAGRVARHVEAAVIDDCGHYIPEEQPAALLTVLLPFCQA